MRQTYRFNNATAFKEKWTELRNAGIDRNNLDAFYPHPVHGLDEFLDPKPSFLRVFTGTGALIGLISGFALTIYSVFSWPLITGGKPLVSIPAFLIIAFELTILFGAVISFVGFLLLAGLPSVKNMLTAEEYGNDYVIIVNSEDDS